MNVASLELCKELYELSGWANPDASVPLEKASTYWTSWVWCKESQASDWDIYIAGEEHSIHGFSHLLPAYDLGYVIRKLPPLIGKARFPVICYPINMWVAGYTSDIDSWHTLKQFDHTEAANTPEDAACKLAIELLKQGILKKDA